MHSHSHTNTFVNMHKNINTFIKKEKRPFTWMWTFQWHNVQTKEIKHRHNRNITKQNTVMGINWILVFYSTPHPVQESKLMKTYDQECNAQITRPHIFTQHLNQYRNWNLWKFMIRSATSKLLGHTFSHYFYILNCKCILAYNRCSFLSIRQPHLGRKPKRVSIFAPNHIDT